MLSPEIDAALGKVVGFSKVVLFMKGTKVLVVSLLPHHRADPALA